MVLEVEGREGLRDARVSVWVSGVLQVGRACKEGQAQPQDGLCTVRGSGGSQTPDALGLALTTFVTVRCLLLWFFVAVLSPTFFFVVLRF